MSDEALNAHLDWLDKALEQNMDYETWLEKQLALIEAENAALSELLSPLVDVELERDIAMSENQRLTKHVEDYEEENANLVERSNRAMTRAIQAEAKLTAIECAGCGKTMLECACDDTENG